jgi:hypothetical protein
MHIANDVTLRKAEPSDNFFVVEATAERFFMEQVKLNQ